MIRPDILIPMRASGLTRTTQRPRKAPGSKTVAKKRSSAAAKLAEEPAVSRREAGKRERRHRIIAAAHDLIRETGNAGLSMRALAARAGVSLATPYNLFGSKRAIVWAVLDDVREYQDRFARLRPSDPVERIFAALDLALEFYKTDSRFYKILWAAVFDISDEDVRTDIFNSQRNAFWLRLLSDAIAAGAIVEDVSPEILLQQLDFILRSAMFGWVVGEISQKKLTPTVFCGVAMLLKGAATQGWQGPLQARLQRSLGSLSR